MPYLFISCLDYVLRTCIDLRKENGLTLKKAKSRRDPTKTMTDTNYADALALLVNASTQTKSLQHSSEQAAEGIGFYLNANKKEHMYFKQGATSTLSCKLLKLVSQSRWKSNFSDEVKRNFFQAVSVSIQLDVCTTWALTKRLEKSLMETTQECCVQS